MKTILVCLIGIFAFGFAQQSRIAFINPDGQLATINPDGSEQRVLTEGNQRLQFPAWSPDGSKLAVIGVDLEGSFIRILADATDSKAKEIYRHEQNGAIYLYWSPDGKTVSFLANNPESNLALHMASETEDARIVVRGAPFYWQWTKDSQNLLIHSNFTGPNSRLGFTSAIFDNLQDNLAPPGMFQSPGISASGKYIAYAEDNPVRGTQVVIQNNPLENPLRVRREVKHEGAVSLSWSPTEDKLAFISPEQDARNVYGHLKLLEAENGLLEELNEAVTLAFFWSPDGKYIAYITPVNRNEPDVSESGPNVLIAQTVQSNLLFEAHIVDVTTKEDTIIGTFTPTFLFVTQFLPFFDQYALSHSIWSPQSDAIVLPTVDAKNTEKITVFSLDGKAQTIADGDTPFWIRK
jgi:Tol biopolymer transport system component